MHDKLDLQPLLQHIKMALMCLYEYNGPWQSGYGFGNDCTLVLCTNPCYFFNTECYLYRMRWISQCCSQCVHVKRKISFGYKA